MTLSPELQGILLAILGGPVMVALHVALFRWRGEDASGNLPLYAAFVGYHLAWMAAAWTWWGESLTLSQNIAGLSTCIFACLAYMQVYSQICRGFSLRILVDIERCEGLSLEGILAEYADGRGAAWLLDKRIDTLCAIGLLHRRDGGVVLASQTARRLGQIGIAFKRIVKPAQGG